MIWSPNVFLQSLVSVLLWIGNAAASNDCVAGKPMMSKPVFGTQEFPVFMQKMFSKVTLSLLTLWNENSQQSFLKYQMKKLLIQDSFTFFKPILMQYSHFYTLCTLKELLVTVIIPILALRRSSDESSLCVMHSKVQVIWAFSNVS